MRGCSESGWRVGVGGSWTVGGTVSPAVCMMGLRVVWESFELVRGVERRDDRKVVRRISAVATRRDGFGINDTPEASIENPVDAAIRRVASKAVQRATRTCSPWRVAPGVAKALAQTLIYLAVRGRIEIRGQ